MFKAHLPDSYEIEQIARDSGLVQRRSTKFSASGFLIALIQSVTKGDTSLNQIALHLSAFESNPMSRQAMFQRFGPAATRFLLSLIERVLHMRFPAVFSVLRDSPFRRVIVEDTTVVSMARSNAGHFPNNGNGRYETAGCKCLLSFDMLRGEPVAFQLHAARAADQALAYETADQCRSGDLVLRDMGFFNIEALRLIGQRNAFWISRLPASASLVAQDGTPLAKLLKTCRFDHIDSIVLLGRERLPCRLVAYRLNSERAAANRRLIRSEAKRRRVTPTRETSLRSGWRILVTNIEGGTLGPRQISALYALRWSVEIQFRAFKQSCQISRGLKHRSGFHHIEAMVLAAILYQIIALRIHSMLSRKSEFKGWLSVEKTCDAISIHLMRITSDPATWRFEPDPRHLRYERRKRTNHWQRVIHSLA